MYKCYFWLVLLVLTACTSLPIKPGVTLSDVEFWIQHQQYAKAQEAIEKIDPMRADARALADTKSRLNKIIHDHEQTALGQADEFIQAKQWASAINVLNDALYQLPNSQRLLDKLHEVSQARETNRHELLQQLYYKQASSILENKKQYEQLAKYHKDDQKSQVLLQHSLHHIEELQSSLIDLSRYYLRQERLEEAKQSLILANRLSPDSETGRLLREVEQKLSQRGANDADKKSALISEAQLAMDAGELLRARNAVNKLATEYPDSPETNSLQGQLLLAIDEAVQRGLEEGRREYQQRNIQKALEIWQPLLNLKPGDRELASHIERARRVINKLEELTVEDGR